MFAYGTNVRKTIIHYFVTQYLIAQEEMKHTNSRRNSDPVYRDWRWPFFTISSFQLREKIKELVLTDEYKSELGCVKFPFDFNNIPAVRMYKNPWELRKDKPLYRFVGGRMVEVWDHDDLLTYSCQVDGQTIQDFLMAFGPADHEIAIKTMYRDFTYGEIKVPEEVFERMQGDHPGCFGSGWLPVPRVSEWSNQSQKDRRGVSPFVKDKFQ